MVKNGAARVPGLESLPAWLTYQLAVFASTTVITTAAGALIATPSPTTRANVRIAGVEGAVNVGCAPASVPVPPVTSTPLIWVHVYTSAALPVLARPSSVTTAPRFTV
ncbi:MAG: hypothetical protein KA764_05540 [Anaerolineales bacterium]|nr:hypothetical protein [Anaerolineales bacterium]